MKRILLVALAPMLSTCTSKSEQRPSSYTGLMNAEPASHDSLAFEAPSDTWEVIDRLDSPIGWATRYRFNVGQVATLRHLKSEAVVTVTLIGGAEPTPAWDETRDHAWKRLRNYHDCTGEGDLYDFLLKRCTPRHATRTFSLVEFEQDKDIGCGVLNSDGRCNVGFGFSFVERETSHEQSKEGLFWKVTDPDYWRYLFGSRHNFKGRVVVLKFDRYVDFKERTMIAVIEMRTPHSAADDVERDTMQFIRTLRYYTGAP